MVLRRIVIVILIFRRILIGLFIFIFQVGAGDVVQSSSPGQLISEGEPTSASSSSIGRRGLSDKLLKCYFGQYKVFRRLGVLNYEVVRDETWSSGRRHPRPEVVQVVRLKPQFSGVHDEGITCLFCPNDGAAQSSQPLWDYAFAADKVQLSAAPQRQAATPTSCGEARRGCTVIADTLGQRLGSG
ncbi:hypothetical protein HPB47_018459 [Ixodes persulcatus]|uniref:Uncharacterized protein n=1 Tax=Ixodes persulcatus TaxID=34615 RepID=A0AC60QKU9_IXOPE|nr:hypothetical protein HPB47_018459 [Ixodes persulcatus]